jgi:hypothetical protein
LSGFGLPAVVGGASHANDAVSAQAQSDAATAFGVAAAQPVSPGNVLTGTDLGNRTLGAGAYRYASSAQLTGALTLDGAGDANAQFVFEIGSTLTSASASSIVLRNGASACNVFWQIGSSATLGSGTAFQGNLLAATAVTLNTGASLIGRAFARTAAVSLDSNVIAAPACPTSNGPAATGPDPTANTGNGTGPTPDTGVLTTGGVTTTVTGESAQTPAETNTQQGSRDTSFRRVYSRRCSTPFHALVRGREIATVAFSLDGELIATRKRAPFGAVADAGPGHHRLTALIVFSDGRPTRTRQLNYRACARALLQPGRGPAPFAG